MLVKILTPEECLSSVVSTWTSRCWPQLCERSAYSQFFIPCDSSIKYMLLQFRYKDVMCDVASDLHMSTSYKVDKFNQELFSWGCSLTRNIQGQVGWDLEQSDLWKMFLSISGGVGWDDLPFCGKLFCGSMIQLKLSWELQELKSTWRR